MKRRLKRSSVSENANEIAIDWFWKVHDFCLTINGLRITEKAAKIPFQDISDFK